MSETKTNGQDSAAAAEPMSLMINAQYLRDLSFENPRAPDSLLGQNGMPEVKVDVDVKVRQLNPDIYESVVSLKVAAQQNDQIAFVVEVDYGAVVTIKNAPEDVTAALLLIEAPRLIFPFIRAVVADATRDGGFPPLLINPIDFADVQRRKAEHAKATAEATASA